MGVRAERALRGRVVTRVAVTMSLHFLAVNGRPRTVLQCTITRGQRPERVQRSIQTLELRN